MIHIYGFPLGRYDGFSFFFFIFFKSKKPGKVLINHEKIHFYQQLELLFLPHWTLYVLQYLFFRIRFAFEKDNVAESNHDRAYRMICFEREAYENEKDLDYLSRRRPFAWIKYLLQKN
ncbi:MAG: hypothetical protein P8X57_15465 [Cyclobacteriaceae bacterium]